MKRVLALLLGIFLLGSSACASEETVLKLWDVDLSAATAFKLEHPDIGYELLWYDPSVGTLTEMQRLQPDVAVLRLYNDDLQSFLDADMMADLSQSEAVVQAVSRMPDWLQQLVTTEDGQILALPTKALIRPFYWYQDAWDAAGLTPEDVPQSYAELLDFLERWLERIQKAPEKNICVSRLVRWRREEERYNYCFWLMDMLITCHEMQQRHAGLPVDFSTPEFIALAERTRSIALSLYEAEPREAKREKMLQLFQNDLHGGEHANGGRAYGLSHSIPLRIHRTQPALTNVNLEIAFIRKGSPHLQDGLRMLEHLQQKQSWFFTYALYQDFQPGDYAYEAGRTGHIDAGWLKDYHSYEGTFLSFPSIFRQVWDGDTHKEKVLMSFFEGKITAEEMAQKLLP